MKRLLVVLAFVLVAFSCAGQDMVYYQSSPTLQWDAVTLDSNGDPFLPTDTLEYEVYLWDMAGGDPTVQPVSALTLFSTTVNTSVTLSFSYRAEWACVVRTKLTDGGGTIVYSGPAYSTVAGDTATGPFAYSPVVTWVPLAPSGLRDSGI